MVVLATADWMPDAAALGNPGAVRAQNVFPGPTGYKPLPRFEALTNALDDRPRGAVTALDDSLVTYVYAGDESKLYSLSGTTWSDVSKSGGYSTAAEEVWEFARWKDTVIATNFSDNPQVITMGGSNFADLTSAFKARHVAVVRDFVVMANTTDSTDGDKIDRVRWSAFNDATDWTVSSITGSDVRDLNTGGQIERVFGGEYGVILCQDAVFRMAYTGAPAWFRFDEVLPGVGALAPGAAAQHGDLVFFLSRNGFVRLQNGQQSAFIGAGKVDEFVLNDIDSNHLGRMSAVVDPQGNRVVWAYPGPGNVDGRPNRLVIYDYALDRWSYAVMETELVWAASGVGLTLEQLDTISSSIDDLGVSLDSSSWKGGAPRLAAFDGAFKHGFFSGAPMDAVVETKEVELSPGRRSVITGLRALVDGGSVSARVGTRSNLSDAVSWGTARTPAAGGKIAARSAGRYCRVEMSVSGDWSDIVGAQVDPVYARAGGARG